MHCVRQQTAGALHLAEEEVHRIDTMRGGVVERAASGQRRVAQPIAAFRVEPAVAVGLGQQRSADGALFHELPCADELGIKAAIVGNAEQMPRRACFGHHLLRLRKIHCHRLLAQHVLARA